MLPTEIAVVGARPGSQYFKQPPAAVKGRCLPDKYGLPYIALTLLVAHASIGSQSTPSHAHQGDEGAHFL